MNLRNTIKKYLFLTFLSGAAVCGCSDKKENDLEKKLETEVRIYYYLFNKAEKNFKEFISDGDFSWYEQSNVLCDLRIMEKCKKEVTRISRFIDVPSLPNSDNLKMIYSPLAKNQRGLDFGTPKLEKILNQNGLNVKVEKYTSVKEIQTPLYILVGALFIKSLYTIKKGGKGWLEQTKSYLRNN